ncbi:unnamed protein product [Peniophora sp. CBMAI 1063]|nr:unnamed protein product [Peniophora sp. CBMAI 1063]
MNFPPLPAELQPKSLISGTFLQVSGQACESCLRKPTTGTLHRCAACRRVSYCNRGCQIQDWFEHKSLCLRLRLLNATETVELIPGNVLSLEEYEEQKKTRIALLTEVGLGGTPEDAAYAEHEVKCEVCLRTPFQKLLFQKFSDCKHCGLAWWCSPECKAVFRTVHTRQQCDALREVHCAERFNIDYTLNRRTIRAINFVTPNPRTTYIPFSSLKGWDDYFEKHFPEYDSWTVNGAAEFAAGNPDSKVGVTALTKGAMVFPLTIASALEIAFPDIATRTSLVIHVVGAARRELLSQATLENILHAYPMLQELRFYFIGPEAKSDPLPDNLACSKCIANGRVRQVLYATGEYHECQWALSASGPKINKPDFIVAFNSGMLESEASTASWGQTVKHILDSGVPTLFTATTRTNALMEVGAFRAGRVRFLSKMQKNKFHGPVHIPNAYQAEELMEGGPHTTAYNSHYMCVVKGRYEG